MKYDARRTSRVVLRVNGSGHLGGGYSKRLWDLPIATQGKGGRMKSLHYNFGAYGSQMSPRGRGPHFRYHACR